MAQEPSEEMFTVIIITVFLLITASLSGAQIEQEKTLFGAYISLTSERTSSYFHEAS